MSGWCLQIKCLVRLVLPLFVGCLLLNVTRAALAFDLDEDGLDDALERALIDLYRPEYVYDSGESKWPSTARWFVRYSRLDFGPGRETFLTQEQLFNNPEDL